MGIQLFRTSAVYISLIQGLFDDITELIDNILGAHPRVNLTKNISYKVIRRHSQLLGHEFHDLIGVFEFLCGVKYGLNVDFSKQVWLAKTILADV